MLKRLTLFVFLSFLSATAAIATPPVTGTVAKVINGKSFVLDTGDTVRLASIEVPNVQELVPPHRPGEPMGEEAKKALETLVLGKAVRIDTLPMVRDRHNRLIGQVYLADGMWVQGEMLREGWGMVYSFSDDAHESIVAMLAREREAQKANVGIWKEPYFRIITPAETGEFINRFKIVEGRLVSVNTYHDHIYMNFSERWKGSFAVFISRKFAGAFSMEKLQALVGKSIRVRGWINYHNAPMIDINHPEQIEPE